MVEVEELEQPWVSLSIVALILSPFRPMLSPERPTPLSVERVVVRRLNLVFGTSKPGQKESARTKREFF
jgi:hypothetical protein